MENTVSHRIIVRNGKIAKLFRARKTYECDLAGCTGVILPSQEYYLISYPQTDKANYSCPVRVHVTDIEHYFKQDSDHSST